VAVHHDENGNRKMDANALGIPKEGYGASRNPKSRFGPPSFSDARMRLKPNTKTQVRIKVRYF
jgi:uncharacterized protein (DUF2141 family)